MRAEKDLDVPTLARWAPESQKTAANETNIFEHGFVKNISNIALFTEIDAIFWESCLKYDRWALFESIHLDTDHSHFARGFFY